jgi:hypothetical protein
MTSLINCLLHQQPQLKEYTLTFVLLASSLAFFALHQPVGILKDFTIHRFSGGMSRISSTAPAEKVWLPKQKQLCACSV